MKTFNEAARPLILIADDDATIHIMASACLEEFGFDVVCAADGVDALELIQKHQPDLVVLDVIMPEKDGYEVCQEFRRMPAGQSIPVLMMTALDDADAVNKAYDAGATEFVTKPVNWAVESYRLKNMLKAAEDRRELELSRTEWERTFDAIDYMVLVVNSDRVIIQANAIANAEFGGDTSKLIGRRCCELCTSCEELCSENMIQQTFATGEKLSVDRDNFLMGRNYRVSTFPVFNADGEVIRVVHTAKDITVRLQLEQEVRRAQKMDAVGALAGGLAHDFNNLLQVIIGYAELLSLDLGQGSRHIQDLEQIKNAVRQGREVTQQLLMVSKRTESKMQRLELNSVVQGVAKLLSRTMPKKITLDLELDRGLLPIRADASQIEQVLMNLTMNAKHAMLDGGTLVFRTKNIVQTEEQPLPVNIDPGKYVLLEVGDTGCGMDKQTLSRIFEPFFTTRSPDKGTGLGLSMVYGIVQKHDAALDCRSELDKGTAFSIYFPAFEAETDLRIEKPQGNDKTVLLVDDDISVLRIVRRMLEIAGCTVKTARNQDAALEAVRDDESPVGVVVMDLRVPSLDGMRFIEKLLSYRAGLSILLESRAGLSKEELFSLGDAVDIIDKPYSEKQLLEGIRKMSERG